MEGPSPAPQRAPPARRTLLLALAGALIASTSGALWSWLLHAQPVDDAYISLRAAVHLAQGGGPLFNLGARVESASSPLWVALSALLIRCGMGPLAALDLLGAAALAAAGAAVSLLAADAAGLAAGLGAALLLSLFPAWSCWTLSGLETALAAATLAFAMRSALRGRTIARASLAGFAATLAAAARPESIALLPLLGLAVWAASGPRRARRAAAFALAAIVPLAVLLLARHAYFGEWLPNTYIAKVSGGGLPLHLRGARYVAALLGIHAPLALGAAAALAITLRGGRRPATLHLLRSPGALCALAFATLCAALAWDGGDHFPLFRLAVPALPLALAATLSALASAPARWRPGLGALALAALLCSAFAESRYSSSEASFSQTGDLARYQVELGVAQRAVQAGRALQTTPCGRVAAVAIGAIGYESGLSILDLVGIADSTIARSPHLAGAAAGHDHADVNYVLKAAPDCVVFIPELSVDALDDTRERSWLSERRAYYQSALLLLDAPLFQQRWTARDLQFEPGIHLRVWIRRDLLSHEDAPSAARQ